MLKIRFIEGRACPFVHCDSCGERIDRCDEGIVQIFSDGRARFVHRATPCDDRSDDEGWYGLDTFLVFLLQNVGYNASKAKHQVGLLTEAGDESCAGLG